MRRLSKEQKDILKTEVRKFYAQNPNLYGMSDFNIPDKKIAEVKLYGNYETIRSDISRFVNDEYCKTRYAEKKKDNMDLFR